MLDDPLAKLILSWGDDELFKSNPKGAAMKNPKPVVRLEEEPENVFVIIGKCRKAWAYEGGTVESWNAIRTEMVSGDFNHLMTVVDKHFTIEVV
jgi:hypothetical protein